MHQSRALWLCFLLGCSFLLSCASSCVTYDGINDSSLVVVGTGQASCADQGCVYCHSIADAANIASEMGVSEVILESGFYEGAGNSNVSTVNISFLAAEGAAVVIDCGWEGSAFIVSVTQGNEVSFSGLEIRHCAGTPIEMEAPPGEEEATVTEEEVAMVEYYGGAIYVELYGGRFFADNLYIHDCNVMHEGSNADGSGFTYFGHGGGLAVRGDGFAEVRNVIFENIVAFEGSGIYMDLTSFEFAPGGEPVMGSATIAGCTFTSCSADSSGGGFWATSVADLTVESCSFVSNSGGSVGGFYADFVSNLLMTDCTFLQNSATASAGALFLADVSGGVENCNFTANEASNFGGALQFSSPMNAYFQGCTFEGNVAQYGGALSGKDMEGYVLFESTTFIGNRAQMAGGAMFFEDLMPPPDKPLWEIQDCSFMSNFASRYGAAVFAESASLRFTACGFASNTGDMQLTGAAVYAEGSETVVTFSECDFTDQLARTGSGVSAVAATVEFSSCLFSNLTCFLEGTCLSNPGSCMYFDCGAGIHATSGAQVVVSGSYFVNVHAAIIAQYSDVTVSTSDFLGNYCYTSDGGGGIRIDYGKLQVSDCDFANNTATASYGGGGAISGRLDDGSHIIQSSFRNNSASVYGGAILAASSNDAHVLFADCDFVSNEAGRTGGAIMVETLQYFTMERCNFTSNRAGWAADISHTEGGRVREPGGGGGVAMEGSALSLVVRDCYFFQNEAVLGAYDGDSAGDGGGLHVLYDNPLELVNCVFDNNTAQRNGGGFYHGSLSDVILENCNFTRNRAGRAGGGISVFGFLEVKGIHVEANEAVMGGGVYLQATQMTLAVAEPAKFTNNKAINGGGIAMDSSSIRMQANSDSCNSCARYLVNDGTCDPECFDKNCFWDGMDCLDTFGAPLYNENITCDCTPGNGLCEFECFNLECDFDLGDCDNITTSDIFECPHFTHSYFSSLEDPRKSVQFVEEGSHCKFPFTVGSESFSDCVLDMTVIVEEFAFCGCDTFDPEISSCNSPCEEPPPTRRRADPPPPTGPPPGDEPPTAGGPPPTGGEPPATGGGEPPATGGGEPPATGGGEPPPTGGGEPPATGGGEPPATGGGEPPPTGGGEPPEGPPSGEEPPTGNENGAPDGPPESCADNPTSGTVDYNWALMEAQSSGPYKSSLIRGTFSYENDDVQTCGAYLMRVQGIFTAPSSGRYTFSVLSAGETYVYMKEAGVAGSVLDASFLVAMGGASSQTEPEWDVRSDVVDYSVDVVEGVGYHFVVDLFYSSFSEAFMEFGIHYPNTVPEEDGVVEQPCGTNHFALPPSHTSAAEHEDEAWCMTSRADASREKWGVCTNLTLVYKAGMVDKDEVWVHVPENADPLGYESSCFDESFLLSGNYAAEYGGGLYAGDCSSNDVVCFATFPHNMPATAIVIRDNYAGMAGGGGYIGCHTFPEPCLDDLLDVPPLHESHLQTWYFRNNFAGGYGNNRATAPSFIDVSTIIEESYYSAESLTGAFKVMDYFRQKIVMPDGADYPYTLRTSVCNDAACPFTSILSVQHHGFNATGDAEIMEHSIFFPIDKVDNEVEHNVTVEIALLGADNVDSLYFKVTREPCPAGTMYFYSTTYGSEDCIPCEYGTYSILEDSPSCNDCPSGATCPGGVYVNADDHYWTPCRDTMDLDTCNHDDGEIELWKCPVNGGCRGAELGSSTVMECAESFVADSRVCKSCKDGYWMFQNGCHQCESEKFNIINVIVGFLLLFWLPTARWAAVNFPFLYIALAYFQILSIISEFNIEWPEQFRSFIQTFSVLNFDISFSQIQCFLPRGDFFMIRFLLYMLLPFLYFVIYFGRPVLWRLHGNVLSNLGISGKADRTGIAKYFSRAPTEEEIQEAKGLAIHTFLFTLNQLYLSCITKAFQIFGCANYGDDDHYYLVVSPSVSCEDHKYKIMLVVAIIALCAYLLCVPCLFGWIVGVYGKERRLPSHPQSAEFKGRYGFLYARFKPEFCYWEFVTIGRKLGFSVMRTFLQYDSVLQTSLCMILVVVNIMSQYACRPFTRNRLNILECVTLASIFCVLLLAHMYNSSSGRFYSSNSIGGEVLGFLAMMMGLCAVFIIGYFDIRAKYSEMRETAGRVVATAKRGAKGLTNMPSPFLEMQRLSGSRPSSRVLVSTADGGFPKPDVSNPARLEEAKADRSDSPDVTATRVSPRVLPPVLSGSHSQVHYDVIELSTAGEPNSQNPDPANEPVRPDSSENASEVSSPASVGGMQDESDPSTRGTNVSAPRKIVSKLAGRNGGASYLSNDAQTGGSDRHSRTSTTSTSSSESTASSSCSNSKFASSGATMPQHSDGESGRNPVLGQKIPMSPVPGSPESRASSGRRKPQSPSRGASDASITNLRSYHVSSI
eukprot:Rmarinus@m.24909